MSFTANPRKLWCRAPFSLFLELFRIREAQASQILRIIGLASKDAPSIRSSRSRIYGRIYLSVRRFNVIS